MVQLRLIDVTDSPNVQDWVASTAVRAKEVRVQAGVLYRRKADGTTRATFDATELALWDALGGGGSTYTDEQAQDAVAAMFGAGSNVGVTFTYDDAGNRESAVVTATGGAASTITFTPSGGLSATNVGAALVELDAEKESVAHATATYQSWVTGLTMGATPTTPQATANAAAINAALQAVRTSTGGTVRLPKGIIALNGRLTVNDGVSLIGEGGSDSYSGTKLVCTTAGDGIDIIGSGGTIADFEIDGADTANYPFKVGLGDGRTFRGLAVHNALLDCLTVEFMQNSVFTKCAFVRSGRSTVVLDKECGGLLFEQCDTTDQVVHGVHIKQSVAPTTAYTKPSHITFLHCLIERTSGDNATVNIDNGFLVKFDQCVFTSGRSTTTTAPIMLLGSSSGPVMLEDGQFAGNLAAAHTAIRLGAGAQMTMSGRTWFQGMNTILDNPSGTVIVLGEPFVGDNAAWVSAGTPASGDQNITRTQRSATMYEKASTGGIVQQYRVTTESGARIRVFADGRFSWGDGTNYTFATTMYRAGDGRLRVDGPGFVASGQFAHIGTQLGFYNTAPANRPTLTYSRATESAATAALRAALAAVGLVVDSTVA